MPKVIDNFDGKYEFLSNFYPSVVYFDGAYWQTVEHAYQAAKTLDWEARKTIWLAPRPGQAKALGQKVVKREGWEETHRERIMLNLLRQKFAWGTPLSMRLVMTGDAHLIEGNDWGDVTWGMVKDREKKADGGKEFWVGRNLLGEMLMQVRREIVAKGGIP